MNKVKQNPDAPEVLIGPVMFPGGGGIGRVVSRGGRISPESWTPSGWVEGGFEMVDLAQSRKATPDDLKAAGITAGAPDYSKSCESPGTLAGDNMNETPQTPHDPPTDPFQTFPNPNQGTFKYYDDWKSTGFNCPRCHWHGLGSALKTGEITWDLFELDCPSCGDNLTLVSHASLEEMRANWDKLTPKERKELEGMEQRCADRQSRKLKRSDQLPAIDQPSFVLTWDHDGDDTAIKLQNQVVWSERAYFECYDRFIEIAEILRERYGAAVRDLAPTHRSEFYLYGDRLSAPDIIEEARNRIFAVPPKPEGTPGGFADDIAEGVAEEVRDRITTQTRIRLQRMSKLGLLDGNDAMLKSCWDEACVQMQSSLESDCWSYYESRVRGGVMKSVAKLPRHEAKALWMNTDDAIGCFGDPERLETEWTTSATDDSIVDHIITEHIYPTMDRWKNQRIRAYLDQSMD